MGSTCATAALVEALVPESSEVQLLLPQGAAVATTRPSVGHHSNQTPMSPRQRPAVVEAAVVEAPDALAAAVVAAGVATVWDLLKRQDQEYECTEPAVVAAATGSPAAAAVVVVAFVAAASLAAAEAVAAVDPVAVEAVAAVVVAAAASGRSTVAAI